MNYIDNVVDKFHIHGITGVCNQKLIYGT